MKQVLFALAASVCVIINAWCGESDVVKVKGTGTGETLELALKDAYRDAVESAVGMFVDSEQMVSNDELIKDQILTQSNAYIEDYDVIDKKESDGSVKIKILARVKKQALTKKIDGVMPAKTVKLGGGLKKLHAESTTLEKRATDASALLSNALEGVDPVAQLLDVTLASSEGVPLPEKTRMTKYGQESSGQDGFVEIAYLFKFEINKKRYFEEFLPKLNQTLEQISVVKPTDVVFTAVEKNGTMDNRRFADSYRSPDGGSMAQRLMSGIFYGQVSLESAMTGRIAQRETYCVRQTPDPIDVVIVTEANNSMTMVKGRCFELDGPTAQIVRNWHYGVGTGSKADVISASKRRKSLSGSGDLPTYAVSFLDDKGSVLVSKEIGFQRMRGTFRDSISCEGIFHKSMMTGSRKRTKYQRGSTPDNNVWMIAPLLGADAQSYYQWYSFKLPKEELPKIDSIKIELVH